jgi:two-component system, LytTR family, sensor kinase
MKSKRFNIILHIIGWLAFFSPPILVFTLSGSQFPVNKLANGSPLPAIVGLHIFLIIFFYANCYWLLPKYYQQRSIWLYFTIVLVCITLYIYFYTTLQPITNSVEVSTTVVENQQIISPAYTKPNTLKMYVVGPKRMGKVISVFFFLFIWALSSMLYLLNKYQKAKEQNKELALLNKSTELSYLKAQINPHFLFNSLNNIYSLALLKSDYTADAVVMLSDIMRYVTQDAEKTVVPLQKEIDYIANYIKLQQIRSNENVVVNFSTESDFSGVNIAPLLLIGFIENAFKFGISNHYSSVIDVVIALNQQTLSLSVSNHVFKDNAKPGTNTGLKNIKRRLQLQYPNKHLLHITETESKYLVNLEITIA